MLKFAVLLHSYHSILSLIPITAAYLGHKQILQISSTFYRVPAESFIQSGGRID